MRVSGVHARESIDELIELVGEWQLDPEEEKVPELRHACLRTEFSAALMSEAACSKFVRAC